MDGRPDVVVGLAPDALLEDLRARAFAPSDPPGAAPRIGVEVELIPVVAETGAVAPMTSPEGPATVPFLEALAARYGWLPLPAKGGVPRIEVPGGGRISFEPGGQIEYSSPPLGGLEALRSDLGAVLRPLFREAPEAGLRLVTRGIDPENPVGSAPLQIPTPRYRRMARYFDGAGPAGRRMMRQTAATHVNLDFGAEPVRRWCLANRLSPALVSIFANSPRCGGTETGYRSFRAQQWRELACLRAEHRGSFEPDRIPTGVDVPARYLEFALSAPGILLGPEDAEVRPFGAWMEDGAAGWEDWRSHLSTLFPEVRPRGYMEIRSCDALHPRDLAAPLVFLAGILYDSVATSLAEEVLDGWADSISDAGRIGLRDPARASRCRDLFGIALEGARRLGPPLVDGATLEAARGFAEELTARGKDPGDLPDVPGDW